ncbi:MAG: oligosaccharide flippase family protein [Thaumarchaeota archaeon]|nr:oligosaccharide flippase family protein [Nitrososphaerota archaeon]
MRDSGGRAQAERSPGPAVTGAAQAPAGGEGSPTVRGMYHLFLGNLAFTLLLAVTAIIVGRVLGPSGYGLYTVALIVPPFLFTAVRLGLDSAATRFAARLSSEGKGAEAVSFVHAMAVFGTVVAAAAAVGFLGLSGWIANTVVDRPELGGVVIPIALVSVLGQAAYNITDLGMTGLGRFGRSALLQALQGAVKLGASVGLVLLGYGVAGAVAGYTASFVVSGGIGLGYVAWLARGKLPVGAMAAVGMGVRYAFPICVAALVSGFVTPALYTVMALTGSNTQIGGYAEAGMFNSLMALLTYPITTTLFPLFSANTLDRGSLGRTYQKAVAYTALLVTPVAAFVMVFAGPLMVTIFGGAFAFASPYLALFAATNLLAGAGSLAWSALLNGVGRTRDALWTSALGSAVSVATGAVLVGAVGAPGAIVGLTAGGAVSLGVSTRMVGRELGVWPRGGRLWRFYAASGASAALSWPASWLVPVPALALGCGAVLFVLLLIPLLALLSALDGAEVRELRGFLGFSPAILRAFGVAVRYYEASSRAFRRGRAQPG